MSCKSLPWLALAPIALCAATALAERPPEPKKEADLIVTGRVVKVYTNVDAANVNYIIAIEVESIEKGQGVQPGQILDARCFRRRPEAPRVPAAYGHRQFPREGEVISAYLMHRPDGTYEGTYPDWSEPKGPGRPGGPPVPLPVPSRWVLGVFVQPVALAGRAGLQISQVSPGGPAQRAGLEAGDIILAAGGAPTRTLDDLFRAIAQSDGTLRLTVRDVRTGAVSDTNVTLQPAG